MNKYLLDPNVCPSSLGENDEPVTPGETSHRWDETSNPATCAECGAERQREGVTCPHCKKIVETVGIKQYAYARVHVAEDGKPFDWDEFELTDDKPVDALCGNCGENIVTLINWD